jgi:CHAT domain-containing protein
VVFNSLLALANEATLTGDSSALWRCLDAAQHYVPNARNELRLANARGAAFLERKDSRDAVNAFTQALQLADKADMSTTSEGRRGAQLGLVKSMLMARQTTQGLKAAEEALALNTASGDIESTVTSLRLIAAGYRSSGQAMAAVRVLRVAADLIEAVPIDELDGEQRATYLASQHTVFAELTDIYASETSTDNSTAWLAFEASERGRARSLRYALNQETRNASSPVGAPPAAKYQQLLGAVAAVTAGKAASRSPNALIDEIDRLAQRDDSADTVFDRAQLGLALKQLDATIVEYANASTEMLAFVVDGESARVVHLGDKQAIVQATAELRDRLRDPESAASEVQAAAETLAARVWWPVAPYVRAHRIMVVPDDALHTVPVAVLPWSQDPAQGMVLQHAESVTIPSALFLLRVHPGASSHSEAPRLALIGDPVFRMADWRRECTEIRTAANATGSHDRGLSTWTESLPRLPGTRLEIDAIAKLAHQWRPASRVETVVGCGAVPSALRKLMDTHVDLLHIATHARIDAQRPRLSALALTPESPAEAPASTFGLLDILGLKLNSKLVVLSACDTSRGRLLPGEGVLGPAQAFLQAGSAAVLATYWKVDDQITSTFMQGFYKYLLVDRLSASAALRRTQLESAASGKSYEWAAFSLYGWPDSSI